MRTEEWSRTRSAMAAQARANDHLTNSEQVELVLRYQAGDTAALDRLLETNLKILHRVVSKSTALKRGCEHEDLMQEASLALMRAAEMFSPELSESFINYAAFHALSRVQRYAENHARTIRLSQATQRLQRRAWAARQSLGHDAQTEQVAEFLGESPETIEFCERSCDVSFASIDEPARESKRRICDTLPDPAGNRGIDHLEFALTADSVIRRAGLNEGEASVVRRIYLDGLSQAQVARRTPGREGSSVTRQRIGQIKAKALTKLKAAARALGHIA